jgi:hypothetical protein
MAGAGNAGFLARRTSHIFISKNALRARAQGEADATTIRAKAQAETNKQFSASLTPDLIRYQVLQTWDGKLPVFNGGGVTPLVDVTGIMPGTPVTAPAAAP